LRRIRVRIGEIKPTQAMREMKKAEKVKKRNARLAIEAAKADEQKKSWNLWLDCLDERQIATKIGTDKSNIEKWRAELTDESAFDFPSVSRQHFDIWNFKRSDSNTGYFGHMPPQIWPSEPQ
jgi:hypothetical protein